MEKFIQVYHNVISQEKCQYSIDKFRFDLENQEVQNNAKDATLTQINLLHSPDTIWREDKDFITKILMENVIRYRNDCDVKPYQWPENFNFEPPKIKRYLPDTTDEFPEHVDVTGTDNLKRFLVLFVYLNNNDKGETIIHPNPQNSGAEFPCNDVSDLYVSKCKQGSCLIFPPFWPWVHAGRPPIKGPKYIIGSYLHYV